MCRQTKAHRLLAVISALLILVCNGLVTISAFGMVDVEVLDVFVVDPWKVRQCVLVSVEQIGLYIHFS